MAELRDICVTGDFTGYFYTRQKRVLGNSEVLPPGMDHTVNLYRGSLQGAVAAEPWDASVNPDPSSLLLQGIQNIAIVDPKEASLAGMSRGDFKRILLTDFSVDQTFEKDGKSYGRIRGKLKGIMEVPAEIEEQQSEPLPPEESPVADPSPIPEAPEEEVTVEPEPTPGPGGGDGPGAVTGGTDGPGGGSGGATPVPPAPQPSPPEPPGCLDRLMRIISFLWRVLLFLMLLLFLIWLFQQCRSCTQGGMQRSTDEECVEENQRLDSALRAMQEEDLRKTALIDSLQRVLSRNKGSSRTGFEDSILVREKGLRKFTPEEEEIREQLRELSNRIYFYGGTDDLREESFPELDQLEQLLKANPEIRLEVRGFMNGITATDISYKRALKVKRLLEERGISGDRLVPVDYGNSNPIDPVKKLDERDKRLFNRNMRVEFEIIR